MTQQIKIGQKHILDHRTLTNSQQSLTIMNTNITYIFFNNTLFQQIHPLAYSYSYWIYEYADLGMLIYSSSPNSIQIMSATAFHELNQMSYFMRGQS